MNLDKRIKHNEEYRKPYTGAKVIDCTCCNHGFCEWCKRGIDFINEIKRMKQVDKRWKVWRRIYEKINN